MRRSMKTKALLFTLLATFGLSSTSSAANEEVADFYKGKTVQLLIGLSAGGGYDSYARTLARHLPKHIPGNPNVVPRNVPGAGSLVLMNQLANTLPKDGTVFGTVVRGAAFDPLFGNEQAKFDPTKVNWLGSLNNATSICVAWHDQAVKKWQDLKTTELTVGATGTGADTNLFPSVISELLGFKLIPIVGYPGGNDVELAMERGEVGGDCGWSWSSASARRADWFEQNKVNILFQMSLKKHPDLPDVPLITDLAETDRQKQALRLLFARQVMGRPYLAPPDVPAVRVAALRQAIAETAVDPEFLEDARKQGLSVSFVSGEEIQDVIREAYNASDEIVQIIINAR